MPVYNGDQYIEQAIESVLNQSFSDFEFIITDDGSTDRSHEIVNSFAKQDPRIKIFKNEKNLGVQKSLNRGLEKSRGDFIARIDHDDIWCDKDKLKKQIEFLEQNPDYALVGTGVICIDLNGKKINSIQHKNTDQEIRNHILLLNQFAHPSILIRKKALSEIGSYSEDKKYKNVEDYELWLRIGKKFKFANLPDYSIKYRLNPNGITLKKQFKQRLTGLILSMEYAKFYPNRSRSILIKLLTLPLSRETLDFLVAKSNFARKLYLRLSGTDQKSEN